MADLPDPITLATLTEARVDGNGAFDTLMRAMSGHLEREFADNRLRGADYANVYLNALTPVLQNAVVFLLQKDEAAYKAQLVEAQVRLTETQIKLAEAELAREVLNKELLQAQIRKIDRDILSSDKSDAVLVAQATQAAAQTAQIQAETLNVTKQGLLITAQTDQSTAQAANIRAETQNLTKQAQLIDKQIETQTQQILNLKAEECVLKANYDIALSTNLQTVAQTTLVNQKVATEKAQTSGVGIEVNSVIGKQIALYNAQADGFKRDAEQKAAKMMIDSWNVRRTTDVGTVADATNQLNDANVGRAVQALLAGAGA